MKNNAAMLTLITLFVTLSAWTANAARYAVRDHTLSETEFMARSLALGHQPIVDAMMQTSEYPTKAMTALIVAAQEEWIQNQTRAASDLTTSPGNWARIDHLLANRDKAGSSDERKAIALFFLRRASVVTSAVTSAVTSMAASEERTDIWKNLLSFLLDQPLRDALHNTTKDFDVIMKEFENFATQEKASWIHFPLEALPNDVRAVVINGRGYNRENLVNLQLPSRPQDQATLKLILVSNLFQPMTILFSDLLNSSGGARYVRKPWVLSACGLERDALEHLSHLDPIHNQDIAVLSERSCARATAKSDTEEILEFQKGFLRPLGENPLSSSFPSAPASASSLWVKKPWVWVVAGAIATGAVIAINHHNQHNHHSRSQGGEASTATSPTPNTRHGW
ncbi:MAG: hypothetical protein RBT63_05355 [Bdellovibrionales bacterium]|jgi:hypothetical protein|nr:hypothetical protein [Bdellovibrionales bacterium]